MYKNMLHLYVASIEDNSGSIRVSAITDYEDDCFSAFTNVNEDIERKVSTEDIDRCDYNIKSSSEEIAETFVKWALTRARVRNLYGFVFVYDNLTEMCRLMLNKLKKNGIDTIPVDLKTMLYCAGYTPEDSKSYIAMDGRKYGVNPTVDTVIISKCHYELIRHNFPILDR